MSGPGPGTAARGRIVTVPARPGGLLLDGVKAMAAPLVVLLVASVLLYALDGVPAWLLGEPRDVRRAVTVDDAERRLRARLVLPSYYPSTLAWPPRRVRYLLGPPGAAALWLDDRRGAPHLVIAETVRPGAIPWRLLPEAHEIDRSPVRVGAASGTLARVVVEDGGWAWQLSWEQEGRSMLFRSRGTVDELLRMARSAREVP